MYIDDYSGYSGNKVDILHKTIICEDFIVNFNNVTYIQKKVNRFKDGEKYELCCALNNNYEFVLFSTNDRYEFVTFYERLVKFIKSSANWFEYKIIEEQRR